ncbi:NACHT domain-containing protein [Qipengyuania flava]|uniref:NACHT domain-containing protein n=1 Tax=Qipengyuania flava TaxID=192812 RepID=UPI000A71B6BD
MTSIELALGAAAVKGATGPATNALSRWGRRKYDKFIATYTNALATYITAAVDHCSCVKNILYRDQLAKTDEKYVNVRFRSGTGETEDMNLLSALLHNRRVLVRGRGGAGKTMFTKWTTLRISETLLNHQRIPIYIELRELRFDKDLEFFEDYAFRAVSNRRTKPNFQQFKAGLEAGLFVFILDAADEISKDHRHQALKIIDAFAKHYPEVGILLTSRDFTEIGGMTSFEHFETQPLSREQALTILEKLDYREDIKGTLLDNIKAGNYDKHAFFLENPLLVTILLLTFDQSREIPVKRSAFFKRAFETLYERHDASKEGALARDHHAGLPMDEFEDVFSLFCYGTYINSMYNFTQEELVANFRAAIQQLDLDESPTDIAKDAEESVCLIVKEGHEFVFVHRAFQEYFTAVYIKNYKANDIGDIIEEALINGQGENTLEFLFELDQFSLEKRYVLPKLKAINSKFRKLDFGKIEDQISGLALLFSRFKIFEKTGAFASLRPSSRIDNTFLFAISNIYPQTNTLRIFFGGEHAHDPFKELPLEKIRKSRSSRREKNLSDIELLDVSFSPTSSDWVTETDLPKRLELLVQDLFALEEALDAKYSEKVSKVRKRFSGFGRG